MTGVLDTAPPAVQVLEAAREVAADVASRADRHDREGSFAQENIDALWDAGLGNLTLPGGADLRTTAEAVRIVASGDPSTALVWVMHLIQLKLLTSEAARISERLRDEVVASSLAGPALINALRVEPELGTPARGGIPATRARRDGEGWRITGHKTFATGSTGLRWLHVWAATGDGTRLGGFLVPSDAPGIEIRETWDHLGMRASASHDVLLHDTPVPLDHAIGLAEPGFVDHGLSDPVARGWMTTLVVSVYAGVARAARDWLVGYLNERTPANLGAPLATLPRFRVAVGEIEALLRTGERLLRSTEADLDAGGDAAVRAGRESGLVKVAVTRGVIQAVEQAVALVGNAGLTHHHPLQRHLRDALCSRIHTPQDDSVLLAAGERALRIETEGR
jgi:alkylation response protein AidB-like acyl-CoA dehydrogenase